MTSRVFIKNEKVNFIRTWFKVYQTWYCCAPHENSKWLQANGINCKATNILYYNDYIIQTTATNARKNNCLSCQGLLLVDNHEVIQRRTRLGCYHGFEYGADIVSDINIPVPCILAVSVWSWYQLIANFVASRLSISPFFYRGTLLFFIIHKITRQRRCDCLETFI